MTSKTTGSTTFEAVRTFADMIDDGWLTPVSFYAPEIPVTVSLWPEAIAQYQKHAAGKKALVFCANQQQVAEALHHFLDAGIAAASLVADDSPNKRTATLNGFASGAYLVLISVTLGLDVGDDPSIQVVIMAAPTNSQTRFEVMVVSAMRPQFTEGMTPAEPEHRRATIGASCKPKAIILDFAGNCQRLGIDTFTRRTPTTTHLTIPGSLEWDQAPEVVAVVGQTAHASPETDVIHMPGIDSLPVGTELVDRAHVTRLQAELAAARQQLTLLNPARIDSCKECGSKSLSWFTTTSTGFTGIQQGRLTTNDVTCQFVLGCDDCSETLRVVNADTFAARLNADTQHAKDAAQ
jgi:hypothetical protein